MNSLTNKTERFISLYVVGLILNICSLLGALSQYLFQEKGCHPVLSAQIKNPEILLAVAVSSGSALAISLASNLFKDLRRCTLRCIGFQITGVSLLFLASVLLQDFPPLNFISLQFLLLSGFFVVSGTNTLHSGDIKAHYERNLE